MSPRTSNGTNAPSTNGDVSNGSDAGAPVEHLDVLIIGAGLSGIGAGAHISMKCPGKSFALLEARDAVGGTWDLFRYPGIRSDSDMFTLGYSFKPWEAAKAIADGPDILSYVNETADEYDVRSHIRFNHRVTAAEWSTDEARWTVTAERTDSGETVRLTAGFVISCSGYYDYEEPFTPEFQGTERFGGQIIHPQHWPEELDYKGKRVVVIGSGATAVTIVPAMAERAGHVTMLQRSPTYIVSMPARDPIADFLRRVLPSRAAYPIVRGKNVALQAVTYWLARKRPGLVRNLIRKGTQRLLPEGYDVDTHFKPKYSPWDQRMCLVPDADLFEAISSGKASMVTDGIETFTEKGLRLTSGEELEADIIVTATGLNLQLFGGAEIVVDEKPVDMADTLFYKGMMFSGIPNLTYVVGYTNASWTLKADLVLDHTCRLINHMDERGQAIAVPRAPASIGKQDFIDLKAGYVLRALDRLPKQGETLPWKLHQNYARDIFMLKRGPVDDEGLEISGARKRDETLTAA